MYFTGILIIYNYQTFFNILDLNFLFFLLINRKNKINTFFEKIIKCDLLIVANYFKKMRFY